jgi:hypothetical protein
MRGWSLRREVRAGGRCVTRDVAKLRFSHTSAAQLLQLCLCLTLPVKTTSWCLDSGSTCTESWPRWRCIHPRCGDTAAPCSGVHRQRAERLRPPCCLNCNHALQSALTTCLLSCCCFNALSHRNHCTIAIAACTPDTQLRGCGA